MRPELVLSTTMQAAARTFTRNLDRMLTATNAEQRMEASEKHRRAEKALPKPELAVMGLMATGSTVAEIAAKVSRPARDIEALLLSACEKLAAHYEAQADG